MRVGIWMTCGGVTFEVDLPRETDGVVAYIR